MLGSQLLYYLILLPLSKLPFVILYVLSDLTYFILYRLIGYRTKVVRTNLNKSFPEKTKQEISRIERQFYKHLCDLIVEGIKAFSLSKEEALKRMKSTNVSLVNQYKAQNRQMVLVGGHYGNWELYAITIGIQLDYKPIALYTPLKNAFMNEKVKTSRSKYGLEMLSIKSIRERLENISDLHAIIFGADQSPRKSQKAHWVTFLNQETGVQFGTEKFAKDFNAVVIFGNIHKIKRGHYEVRYELITEEPNATVHGFISEQHTKLLERDIIQRPEYWLWSHKRWKHKKPS